MGPSLRRGLYKRILLCVLPVVLAIIGVHWYFESRLLEEVFDRSLVERARTLATLVTVHDGRFELEFADEYMPEYSRDDDPFFFQVWLPGGSTLERSVSLSGEDLPYRFGPLERPESFATTLSDGREVRCVGLEFPVRQGTDPTVNPAYAVVIALGADTALLDSALRRGALQVALAAALSILGIAAVVLVALDHGIRVVDRVGAEVAQFAPGGPTEALDEQAAPVEIRPIVRSLNRSMETVRRHVERERRFASDVAHELRTPIAELRAAADVAGQWPDAESQARLVNHSKGIALQMGNLVEGLLELARVEAAADESRPEEVDLGRDVRLYAEQVMKEQGHAGRVLVAGPDSLTIRSYRVLWEVMVRNLLSNALSYSPADTAVRLNVERHGDGVALTVANQVTDGFSEQHLRLCRQRLWRRDGLDPSGTHSGLGLSIVEAACERVGHTFDVGFARGWFTAQVSRDVHAESGPSISGP